MAFRCIRQHTGKSRTLTNTLWRDVEKGELLALSDGSLVEGTSAQSWEILVTSDEDVAQNAEGGFALIDTTMEYEADLSAVTETEISAGTKFGVQSWNLTVSADANGIFVSTQDALEYASTVIGKFVL